MRLLGDKYAKFDKIKGSGSRSGGGGGSDGHALKITVKGLQKKEEPKNGADEPKIKSVEQMDAEMAMQLQEELENEEEDAPGGLAPIF